MYTFWLLSTLALLAGADISPFFKDDEYRNGEYGAFPTQSYLSSPDFVGPVANIQVRPQYGVSNTPFVTVGPVAPHFRQKRPLLLDANSFGIAWAGPQATGRKSYVPRVHQCNGTNLMAWWSGDFPSSTAGNRVFIVNEQYELVYNITAIGPHKYADLHEIYITPECSVILTLHYEWGVSPIYLDEPRFNGTADKLYDSHFQEIDLATGELLFEWQASKSIPDALDDSLMPYADSQGRWDWFHLNSIEKDKRGNYLISSRHTNTIYYISGVDGSVLWRLGGTHSDWTDMSDGKALDFHFQHHARWVDDTHSRITLFDNGAYGRVAGKARDYSRALILELDHWTREVRLQHVYDPTEELLSTRLGSVQVLQDTPGQESVMVGWGEEPAWTEYASNGTVLSDVRFGPAALDRLSIDNYRYLKTNWTGAPSYPPAIAAGPVANYVYNNDTTNFEVELFDEATGQPLPNNTVYFSWNGATEIKSWVILASNSTSELGVWTHFYSRVPKTGFEDSAFVGTSRYVAALAIAEDNTVLGTTPVLDMQNVVRLSGPKGFNGTTDAALTASWQSFNSYAGESTLGSTVRKTYVAHPTLSKAIAAAVVVIFALSLIGAAIWLHRRRRAAKYNAVGDGGWGDDDDEANDKVSEAEENDSMFSFNDEDKYAKREHVTPKDSQ